MIRFSCSNCGRAYLLADALAHLPLLCKACGQRLNVPDPSAEPQAPPEPEPDDSGSAELDVIEKLAAASPGVPVPVPAHSPTPESQTVASPDLSPEPPPADEPLLSPDAQAGLDLPLEMNSATPKPHPVPTPVSRPAAKPPATPAPRATTSPRGGKLLPILADIGIVLIMLVVGVMIGEVIARKPTRTILREAGSAARFPPTNLLMWLGPPLVLVLVYAWLGTRKWTVGTWLKRRAAR